MDNSQTIVGSAVKQCLQESSDSLISSKWRNNTEKDESLVSETSRVKNVRGSEYWCRPFGSTDEVPSLGKMGEVISFCQKNSCRFSKDDLSRVDVIAQLDKKFILGYMRVLSMCEKYQHMLVAFDQHAVHERIRLEKLMAGTKPFLYNFHSHYRFRIIVSNNVINCLLEAYIEVAEGLKEIAAVSINPPFVLNFSDTEIRIISNYQDVFKSFGVTTEPVSTMEVKITSAPKPFADKIANEVIAYYIYQGQTFAIRIIV